MGQTTRQKAEAAVTAVPPLAKDMEKTVDPGKISIWERRLTNPMEQPSMPVLLTEKGWTVRWIDTSMSNRFQRATAQQGWTPVKVEELETSPDLLGLYDAKDGLVRKGLRGASLLVKIPTVVFDKIQRRKAEMVRDGIRRTRTRLAEAASKEFGGDAGEFVMGHSTREGVSGLRGNLVDSRERIGVELEDEG